MTTRITNVLQQFYETHQKEVNLFVLLSELNESEIQELRDGIFNRRGPFFQYIRSILRLHDQKIKLRDKAEQKDAKAFCAVRKKIDAINEAERKKQQTFMETCDSIEHLLCRDHILRNGKLDVKSLNRVARRIGIGCMGDLPKKWSGLVSEEALKNVLQKDKMYEANYYGPEDNTQEHFYNMQYAGKVMVVWILEYDFDRDTFINLCDVFRQVHVTTRDENQRAAKNGQNDVPHVSWQEVYERNNINLVDVGLKEVEILDLEEVAPEGLLDLVDEIFNDTSCES